MKSISYSYAAVLCILLFSCKAIHNTGISSDVIPGDITSGKYKVIYTAINFGNFVSKDLGDIHNNAAKKYVEKKAGEGGIFINETEIAKEHYSNTSIYRYALINRITAKVTTTYYRETSPNQKIKTGEVDNYISEFYFIDRTTGKEYPHAKGTSMALWMFKAIVDKSVANST